MRFRLCLACPCLAAAAMTACGDSHPLPTQPTPPAGPTVRLVYAAPQDRPFRPDYSAAVQMAFADLRSWYRAQVGGKTFSLFRSEPEYCGLPGETSYYRVDSWTKVVTDVQGCVPLTYDSPDFRWILYADIEHECDAPGRIGAASRGVAIMGRGDLDGLVGDTVVTDCGKVVQLPVGRWIGGAGHELGHTFGLPHPPGCQEGLPTCDHGCLMWLGYLVYPNTYLRDEEKERLRTSPFFW
jgi:hypothetical protein